MRKIKAILILVLVYASLSAMTLEEVIKTALDKNPTLESIQHSIEASSLSVDATGRFSNPVISYTQNTLDSSQAMSQKVITIGQKIPYYGKRDSKEGVALAQKDVMVQTLGDAQAKLVYEIKLVAYDIWELKGLYNIVCDYEKLTRQNIQLSESYASTSGNQHMGIMSAELSLSDLKIQKSQIKALIDASYSKLSYLASMEIHEFELNLKMGNIEDISFLEDGLVNNKTLAIKTSQLKKSKAMTKSADKDNYPDINLLAGYAMRSNYDDYLNFGVGITLPIYATEDYKSEESRALELASSSLVDDAKKKISYEFKSSYIKMKSDYEVYHIVHDEALPQIEHMFELTNASISTGGDLFKYIDILKQKLDLEKKSVSAISSYNRNKAKISQLLGEIK